MSNYFGMPAVFRARASFAAFAALLAAAAVLSVPPQRATAAPVPEGYTYSHQWFESHDGLQLHAGLYLPADRAEGERHPLILSSTPYTAPSGGATGLGTTGTGPTTRFPELFEHPAFQEGRYAFLAVDVRGFGGSEGCFQYYMPNEAADVATAVEWAAAQPWSDGHVGMWGKSYDAAQMVLGLASRPEHLDATVIQAPGLSAYTALWMNGVHYATGRYGTTAVYTADDLFPAQNAETLTSVEYARSTAAPVTTASEYPTCRADMLAGANAIADRGDPFWADKEPYLDAAGSDIPTFWLTGFYDANTKPVGLDIYESLTGPRRGWFGQFDHLRGHEAGVGRAEFFLDEAFRFLDEHLRGIVPAERDPNVLVEQGNGDQLWRAEEQWPPADAATWTLPVRPGTYADAPGNEAGGSAAGNGTWTITPPLEHDAHLAGEAVLHLATESVTGQEQVVAFLYDIDEEGRARLVTRGAMKLEFNDTAEGFALYPQDWEFVAGHRIGLLLSGSEDTWFTPGVTNTDVQVLDGSTLDLPLLAIDRTEFVAGQASKGSGVAPFAVDAAALSGSEPTGYQPPPAQSAPQEQ